MSVKDRHAQQIDAHLILKGKNTQAHNKPRIGHQFYSIYSKQTAYIKDVVYSVPCNEYSQAYIGQTGRSLNHRIAEHRRALRNGDVTASALAEHVFTAGHKMDLSKATVINAHPHAQTRCLLEPWHIQHEQTPLNRGSGTLPGLYATLLD